MTKDQAAQTIGRGRSGHPQSRPRTYASTVRTLGGSLLLFEVGPHSTTLYFNSSEIAQIGNLELALAMLHAVQYIQILSSGRENIEEIDKEFESVEEG